MLRIRVRVRSRLANFPSPDPNPDPKHLAAVGSVVPVFQRDADLRRAVALGLQRSG